MAVLCVAGTKLRQQLDRRFIKRDRRSDGWIGDAAHSQRFSYHNPDKNGIVWALDVDENFGQGTWRNGRAAKRFADQLIAYAASGLPGSDRILHVVYEDQVASGTYKQHWWQWRGSGYGHTFHIHITFRQGRGPGSAVFPLPILATNRKQMKAWAAALKGKA
jgi:hypothetical protein